MAGKLYWCSRKYLVGQSTEVYKNYQGPSLIVVNRRTGVCITLDGLDKIELVDLVKEISEKISLRA